jgi:hypothetical protein
MLTTVTGTFISPLGTPATGQVVFTLKGNTVYGTSVALKKQVGVLLDVNGSFSLTMVPGIYEVTLPNLTKIEFTLGATAIDISEVI